MLQLTIPLSFILDRLRLCWQETLYGINQGWLERRDPIELAIHKVTAEKSDDEDEIELAGLLRGEESRVVEILQRLACKEPTIDEQSLQLKWMRLILAWLFETKDQFDDPLGIIEGIYADFGYPSEIRALIRYNDPDDGYRPQDHTQEENVARLLNLWHDYVETHAPLNFG